MTKIKLWKVEIRALPNIFVDSKKWYHYTGTATTAEIAVRQSTKIAKKDGLSQIEIETVSLLGTKDFGN